VLLVLTFVCFWCDQPFGSATLNACGASCPPVACCNSKPQACSCHCMACVFNLHGQPLSVSACITPASPKLIRRCFHSCQQALQRAKADAILTRNQAVSERDALQRDFDQAQVCMAARPSGGTAAAPLSS
jgi:hypothetical protein